MTGDEVAEVRAGEELDWAALETYLRTEIPDLDGPFSVMQFPRGSANLTYRVRIGDRDLVVRRPPFGRIAPGAHDMHREHRVLAALNPYYDRAPSALAYCADPDVIGAHFLVTEYRAGVVVWNEIPEVMSRTPDAGHRIGIAVAEALADLHAVDVDEAGLRDLGKPGDYVERQLRGWTRRWDAVTEPGKEVVGEAGRLLTERRPRQAASTLVHNDFKIDNCQFDGVDPSRVTSVFDWDMATVGDPLTDLGTLLNYWPDEDTDAAIAVPGLDRLGLPTKDELVAAYARRRDVELTLADLRWYEAFGCWKVAVILQQLYMRWVRGESTDPRMAERGDGVADMAERAIKLVAATNERNTR